MSRNITINLSERAARELQEVAKELSIGEDDVLRKGLAIMKVFAEAQKQDKESKLMLGQANKVRELKFKN